MRHDPISCSCRRSGTRLRRRLAFGLWALLAGMSLWGQVTPPSFSAFDGTTPAIATPGSPAEAYSLSSIETINLLNGHLNITIPITTIIGRGSAKQTVTVHQEANWVVTGEQFQYNCNEGICETGMGYNVAYSPWESAQPIGAQGVLQARTGGAQCVNGENQQGMFTRWDYALTRLTFIGPDGTEHEFVDQKTGGLILATPLTGTGAGSDRGSVWVATDGSGAVFTSYDPTNPNFATTYNPALLTTQDIYDGPGAQCMSTGTQGAEGLAFFSGILALRDGTKYKILGDYVVGIQDRNGNTLNLNQAGCVTKNGLASQCNFSATDALGRTVTVTPTAVTYPNESGTQQTAGLTYAAMGSAMGTANLITGAAYPLEEIYQIFALQGYCALSPPAGGGTCTSMESSGACSLPTGVNCNAVTPVDPNVLTQVALPNGQSYSFKYDSYGNVAELHLPTGGWYRYTYTINLLFWSSSCAYCSGGVFYHWTIVPTVTSKAVFLHSGDTTPAQVIWYSPSNDGSGLAGHLVYTDGANYTANAKGNVLGSEDHSFLSGPAMSLGVGQPTLWSTDYNTWTAGKESQVNYYDASGTLLRSESTTWQQRPCNMDPGDPSGYPGECWFEVGTQALVDANYYAPVGLNALWAPPHDARVAQKTVTVAGSSASKSYQDVYTYSDSTDTYNNVIELDEYPFSNTTTPWRKTLTAYQSGSAYTTPSVNLISLPVSQEVVDGSGNPKSLTCYSYDQGTPGSESGITFTDPNWSSVAARGNATTVSDWLSGTASCAGGTMLSTAYTYDVAGNILSMLDPRGVTRQWGYSDSGAGAASSYAFPTSITSYTGLNGGGTPFTAHLTWYYQIGKPASTKDINGNTTTYGYIDTLNRLTSVAKPDGGSTTFLYTDTPGAVNVETQVAQSSGTPIQTTVYYDGLGRKSSTSLATNSSPIKTTYAYDGRGRLAYSSLPAYNAPQPECLTGIGTADSSCAPQYGSFTLFDGLNRPVSVTAAGGAVSTTQYMADETLVSDPSGVTRLNTADRFGNLLSVVEDPNSWYVGGLPGTLNYNTSYTYDALNNLLAVSQGGSRSRSFTYDPLKRLLTAQNLESGTISYTYDNSGNLATKLDALSITTSLAYDGLNRVSGKTYSSSPTGVSYAYDSTTSNCNGLGRLSSVTYGTSVTNDSCYDVMGRVTKSSQTTGATTYPPFLYSYDISGALASEQYPSGRTLTNSFDAAGRIIGLKGLFNSSPTAYASNIAYAPQGPLQSVLLGNGITEAWTFGTPQLQPTQLQAGSALTLTWGYGSNTTNNGNILSATISNSGGVNASQSFGYDRVNRLTAASEGGTWTRNYGYDEWGNGWVSLNSTLSLDPTTPTAATNFDANNRLNVDSAAYNAAGNQTAIAGFTNTFDAENRLLTSTLNGVTTTYTYDGDGRRVQKATGGSTTTYVYDAAGQLAAEYATAPPAPPCTTCYLTEDPLGSTRMLTDGTTGKPLALHDYVPFGEEIQAGVGGRSSTYYPSGALAINDTVAQKFTGKERDQETGLDFFDARYFASPQGRFTSPDPLPWIRWQHGSRDDQRRFGAYIANPQNFNMYAYVNNNPLNHTDPTGMNACGTNDDST